MKGTLVCASYLLYATGIALVLLLTDDLVPANLQICRLRQELESEDFLDSWGPFTATLELDEVQNSVIFPCMA